MLRLTLLSIALAACAPPPPPPAEPAPPPTRTVTATRYVFPNDPKNPGPALLSGKTAIAPDEATIQAASVEYARLMSSWKICIAESGDVSGVDKIQGSGFPDWDAAVRRELTLWKFERPQIDGQPRAVCKAVTFVYPLPTGR
jgi:outer membrane biosynthesis protein TonB